MLSVEAIAISTQQVSRQLSTTCTFVFIRKRSIPMNQPPPVALPLLVPAAPKGGAFPSPTRAVCMFLYKPAAFYNFKAAHHNPRAEGASNLITLGAIASSNLGPKGRQSSRPCGRED